MSDTVYVLTIEHHFGSDARVFRSHEGALHTAADFARESWHKLLEDYGSGQRTTEVPAKPPEDDGQTVELYFGENPDEYYVIWPVEMEP